MMYRMKRFVAMVAVLLCAVSAEAEMTHQWHLDGNMANDSAGFLNGTPNNTTATTNLLGQAGMAMEFNGQNSDVTFEENISLSNEGTLELILRPDAVSGAAQYAICSRTVAGSQDRFYVNLTTAAGPGIEFAFAGMPIVNSINISDRIGTGEWIYTGMTWSYDSIGEEYTLTSFVSDRNGTVVANSPVAVGSGTPPQGTIVFGRYALDAHSYFQGGLDEVSIHDTALPLTELQANYDAMPIPEPSMFILFLMGFISLVLVHLRQEKH